MSFSVRVAERSPKNNNNLPIGEIRFFYTSLIDAPDDPARTKLAASDFQNTWENPFGRSRANGIAE